MDILSHFSSNNVVFQSTTISSNLVGCDATGAGCDATGAGCDATGAGL